MLKTWVVCECFAEASRNARGGLHTWHKLGRFVKKGEKGILILAPIVRRSAEQNETDESSTAVYFRAAYVFDGLSWDFRESEFTRSVGKYRAEDRFFDV